MFLLSSLWEDPGFVLVESIYMNTFVISSNCKNGPEEILDFGNNGILFNSDEEESFLFALKKFENLTEEKIIKLKVNAKLKSKEFTLFNHFLKISKILN